MNQINNIMYMNNNRLIFKENIICNFIKLLINDMNGGSKD